MSVVRLDARLGFVAGGSHKCIDIEFVGVVLLERDVDSVLGDILLAALYRLLVAVA